MDISWARLATEVRRRRDLLGLRQGDLESRGGPSKATVWNIEGAKRGKYAGRTITQLEIALRWPVGTVEKILCGEATPADLNAVTRQEGIGHRSDRHAGDSSAKSELHLAFELIDILGRTESRHPAVREAIDHLQAALPHLSRH